MQFTHERKELITVDGSFNVKIETVFKLALGNLTALEFYKVHTGMLIITLVRSAPE